MARADGQSRSKVDKTLASADAASPKAAGQDAGGLYLTLFRTVPDAFAVWRLVRDKKGTPCDLHFVGINDALRQLLGLASDPTGRLMSKEDPRYREREPDMLAVCARVTATGEPETHETYHPGLGRWFRARVSKVADDLVLGAVSDVTDHRETQRRLERLQYSLDRMDDYPMWSDSEGRIIEVSEATCRHLEYTRDELLQMTIFDISPHTDREVWANSWKNLKPPESVRMESQHRTKSGRLYPVELVITAMVFEGHEYHCTYCRDISERKELEQSLRLTQVSVDHAPDLVYWVDPSGRFVYVNQACCELLGYSFEEFHDMHIWEIDASLNPESWPQAWARVDAAGTLPHKETVTDKDGREHEVEVSSTHIEYRGETYGISVARDVTERLRTEESLRLTQFVVDHAPDSMHWLDPEGRFTYANEAACRLLGYSLEELQGMHLWDISPHATFQEFKERWGASKEGGTILFEDVYRAKDGRQFEVEIAAANFHQQGREMGVAFVRDITEWKRAQQSLRDSEERYRQLFELESDAIVLSEEGSGAVMEVNKAACALYGYTKAELLSMRDDGLFCEAERPEPASTAFTGDLTSQWHRKKDGTVFPVEIRSRHFEWKGSQVKVTTVRDVSEHKRIADELEESRQMLRQVLDTLPLEVRWRDRDLRYLGVNLAAARASNLSDPSKAIGMTDQEMPVHNLSEQCRIDDQEVLATTASKLDYVETVDLSNGATVVKRTSKVPLRDRSGDVIGVLAIHENITEQVATRQALREREEQLRQAQKMEAVGRLAGGIAHDFNNVLTTIIGYSDLIRSSEDCPKGSIAEDVGEIRAAAERASGLTRRILAFSRRQTLQPVVLSLNAVVSETERILARTLGADIELRTSLSPDLGLVEVDEHQFVQVLLNLAVNARDAMPDGGVLTIGTANADLDQHFCETHPDVRPGPHVMLSVSDTGTGMDADTMAHAFEPFYTTKPPGEGTGLGLSTVYGVVAQSGGCTCIRSEPGQGATFTVYLPRAQTPTLTPGPASGPGASEGRGKTILVLDGDATFLGLTSRILERRGYNVLGVSNSEQAMATLSDPALNIDALITDTALPGHEQDDRVAAFASTSRPGLPVLFMSAQPRDRMVREGEMSERAACLEKPFTAEELLSRVRASLGEP